MKFALIAALLLASSAACAAPAPAPQAPTPKLERVVMLMRHGIRPPTKAAPKELTSDVWPDWPVDYGLLTPRGAAGVRLLAAADRQLYAARGLFGTGCPAPGAVVIKASGKERAIKTAENWRDGFMPGCDLTVAHPGDNDPDLIFHGLDEKPDSFDGARAYREALALAPKGGIAAEDRAYAPKIDLLAKVLNCPRPACPLLTEQSKLVASPHDRPELEGPADAGSTLSQTLLLEYLEGMPMKDVGWGRVTRAQIEQLLVFHPLKFKYSNRPSYVASITAAPIANEIVGALTAKDGLKLLLLSGHDTNIADLGAFLRVHWQVPSYPADDVPPGSALGLELLKDGKGVRYVRAFYRAQTMDQLREQRALTGTEHPFRQYLPIPGCGDSARATACTLSQFLRFVARRKAG